MTITIDSISTIIGAAGALGTTCFGIVEALKWTPLGAAGFGRVRAYLGSDLMGALVIAYGPRAEGLLRAQYQQDSQGQTAIAKSLRQGIRIGLKDSNAKGIATFLGSVDGTSLASAANTVSRGDALSDVERAIIGRFELAVDARIDSALARAQDVYLGTVRMTASVLAIALAEIAGYSLNTPGWTAFAVGLMAVPLAPVANDLVSALQAATKALRGR